MTTPPSEEPTTVEGRKAMHGAWSVVAPPGSWQEFGLRLIADVERYRAALGEMLLQHDEFIVWPPPEQSIAECRDVWEQGA